MEKYREESLWGKEQAVFAAAILTVIVAWVGWETWLYVRGSGSIGGIIYITAFFGLWFWRFAYRYTYILEDDRLVVVTAGWGLERRLVIGLDGVESFANRYNKKFFRRTGIKKYVYRYSSGDPRPTRILVFKRGEKLQGLLFKASDNLIGQLQELMPAKMLDMEERIKG